MNSLEYLQKWYLRQCDGDWEHRYGATIQSLDNPGWSVTIDLEGTDFAQIEMPLYESHQSEYEWHTYEVVNKQFVGHCGAASLSVLIDKFAEITGDVER